MTFDKLFVWNPIYVLIIFFEDVGYYLQQDYLQEEKYSFI